MAGESASFHVQDDGNTSSIKNHENGGEDLSGEIAVVIENLDPHPASSRKHCCIFKVPDQIRKSNEEAYTPQVISIGPFHRNINNPEMKKMEEFKLSYLKNFTERSETKLEDIVTAIKGEEESIRECYSENIPPDQSDEFVKMILLDAAFIIEYFCKNKTKVNWTDYDREILEPWLCNRMQMDLILLENQLPFFIIDKIYDTAFPSRSKEGHPFIELCFSQFHYYNVQKFDHHPDSVSILHFTDLVRHFCLPPPGRRPQKESKWIKLEMHSATQLDEVELKFKMSNPSYNLSPLELKYAKGVLEIPHFQFDDTTEIYARNLVAFEKYHHRYKDEAYITDYYTFLSFLINTGKDMDVLVREKIVDNWLQDSDVASSMIKKLSGEKGFYIQMNSDYHEMAQELNEFYNNPPKLITLFRVLFRKRLIGTAAVSGFLYILFNFVQAASSVLSLKYF